VRLALAAVCSHNDQVDMLFGGEVENLLRSVTACDELRLFEVSERDCRK